MERPLAQRPLSSLYATNRPASEPGLPDPSDQKKPNPAEKKPNIFYKAVAISPSTAICPWNLFCRDHSRVFI